MPRSRDGRRVDDARVRRARRSLRALQRVTAALGRALTRQDVADVAVGEVQDALGAAEGFFSFVSDGKLLKPAASRSRLERPVALPVAEALRTGIAAWTETGVVYPLVAGERMRGVMAFSFARPRRFTKEDRELVRTLGEQCAQALERTRLHEEERAAHEKVEQLAAELKDAVRRAEDADRRKDQFLAILGHELRNPLAPALTAVELLRQREPLRDLKELQVIDRQLRHLRRLVDDLLDVSRIIKGKITLRRQRRDLGAILSSAIEMVSPLMEKRGHSLNVDVAPGLVAIVDDMRTAQVFANLLTNAANYTDRPGRISIDARRENGMIVFRVADPGVGFEPALADLLFEPFVQVRHAGIEGGLGLGLSLVRSLTEMQGGSVGAHSAGPGRGSTFQVRLPEAPSPPAVESTALANSGLRPEGARGEKSGADGLAGRVLVVDDNRDARELLAYALQLQGWDVLVAHDAESALAVGRERRPQVAVLDIGLPTIDGYELARKLREGVGPLRLIAVTGYGQEHDRERSRAAGFDAHLVKPVEIDALLAALRRPVA